MDISLRYLILQNKIFTRLCLLNLLIKINKKNRNRNKYGTENIMQCQTYKKYYLKINVFIK